MAVDYYIKIDGIEGESMDKSHAKEIRIHSWSWGASQQSSVNATGGSAGGKASLSEISIMKDFDKASPKLFQALTKGTHIKSATITAQKSTGETTGKPFLKLDLTEVFITSVQVSGASEVPSESFSFSYNTFKMEYFMQGETGILTSTGAVSFDVKQNLAG